MDLSGGPAWAGVLAIAASLLVRRLRDSLDSGPRPAYSGPDAGAAPWYCYDYAHRDGARYRFRIQGAGRGFRAYILDSPPYGGRPDSFHATHRVRDAAGVYVCWDQIIPTPEAAEAVARLWADKTEGYIRTGAPF